MKKFSTLLTSFSIIVASQAAIIDFDLIGSAGAGLLIGNEPAVASGGSGGEIGAGITFDDISKKLNINVGWGSANNFTDLSGNATAAHIHGPTASNNGNNGVADFKQTAGVLIALDAAPFTFNNTAASGSVVGTSSALSPVNEAALFAGKLYINIHTTLNGGGEIRGFLVPVPELPATSFVTAFMLGGFALYRRRSH